MKYAIVDFRISTQEKEAIANIGLKVVICPPCNLLYRQVCGHPDMLLHFINNTTAVVHKDMDRRFIKFLNSIGIKTLLSKSSLVDKYPKDIILNALNMPDYFIHNLKYTDTSILENICRKKLVNVNQGYTKCSCAVVSENALITSDPSICVALAKENIDVLKVPPGDILLDGFDYGFIGGCCGVFKDKMLFYGNINKYIYGETVLAFLKRHHIEPICLSSGKLIDRGSIFFI